ncbi:hypothetical protein SUGI_0754710 [Cryptomeria japonica]|nr:hypothetical protein SUGI_0754710 [Cryptomeria japonica]
MNRCEPTRVISFTSRHPAWPSEAAITRHDPAGARREGSPPLPRGETGQSKRGARGKMEKDGDPSSPSRGLRKGN